MFFKQFYIEGLAQISYMIGSTSTGEAVVIDPIRDVDIYLQTANAEGLTITHIFETHIHADFVSGSRELSEKTGASIYLSSHGGKDWQYEFEHIAIKDGDVINIGDYNITVMHTPGHTPEHVIYLLEDTTRSNEPWMAFTGDFLFVGDIGRPDLLGENFSDELAYRLYESIHEKLLKLPDWVEVYPGHGEGSLCGKNLGSKRSSTIGFERKFNYSLQDMSKEDFVHTILQDQPPAPYYFKRMKTINKKGANILGTLPEPDKLQPEQVKTLSESNAVLIDARSPEAFGGAHIKGSYSIPLDSSFPTWVGYVVPPDKPVILIIENTDDIDLLTRQLIRVGYDRLIGYLDGSIRSWLMAGYQVAHIPQISPEELKNMLHHKDVTLLDVRTDSEWNAFRYPFALHMHAGHLPEKYSDLGLNQDSNIVVTCRSGHRGSIASSILEINGFKNVHNLLGGMEAWRNSGGETCSQPGCPEYASWGMWWGDNSNKPVKLTKEISVGSQPSSQDIGILKSMGFRSILNLRVPDEKSILDNEEEAEITKNHNIKCENISVTNGKICEGSLKKLCSTISELTNTHAPLFIHCGNGGRATMVSILYLALQNGWNTEKAITEATVRGLTIPSEDRLRKFLKDYI